MYFKKFNGKQVEVINMFSVGNETYVDLRVPSTGELIKALPLKKLESLNESRPLHEVVYFYNKKKNIEKSYIKGSEDYKSFVKEQELNPVFIENCLKGISKTHKGFVIKFVGNN